MNKCTILFIIASSLVFVSQAAAQFYTQADKETLSTSEIMAAKDRYKTAKIICYEKAQKAKVKNPVDVKKAQRNAYVVCMSSKGFTVSELPESE